MVTRQGSAWVQSCSVVVNMFASQSKDPWFETCWDQLLISFIMGNM